MLQEEAEQNMIEAQYTLTQTKLELQVHMTSCDDPCDWWTVCVLTG